jgi:hypothetical protein
MKDISIGQNAWRNIAGWSAVGISTLITCFWAFWGIIENFHEGWYFESWLSNVGMMVLQYLCPRLIFMGVTLISIYLPRVGGGLHAIFALFAVWFFQSKCPKVSLIQFPIKLAFYTCFAVMNANFNSNNIPQNT